ncbi:MAG: hypothetical protein KH828_07665 [Clostridiales bacterium]|nr:hypothetical protein [Clostridiales bacterium]
MPEVYVSKNQKRAKMLRKIIDYGKADGTPKGEMVKKLGISTSAFCRKQNNPEDFTLGEVWELMDLLKVPDDKRLEILK